VQWYDADLGNKDVKVISATVVVLIILIIMFCYL
jgi:hypothetical protein